MERRDILERVKSIKSIDSIFESILKSMKHNSDSDEILVKIFDSVASGRIIVLLVSQVGRSFYQPACVRQVGGHV